MATTVPVGAKAFVCLSSDFEEPRWREAVVVGTSDNSWVTISIQAKSTEEAQGKLSSFALGSKTYFLSELQCHQLRAFPQGDCLKLGASATEVIKGASNLLTSDPELVYATASDCSSSRAKNCRGGRKRKQFELISGRPTGEAEKELARRWYLRRTWGRQRPFEERQEKQICPSGKRSRERKECGEFRPRVATTDHWDEEWCRSSSDSVSPSIGRQVEEPTKEKEPAAKVRIPKHFKFSIFEQQQSGKAKAKIRTRPSHRVLSSIEAAHVQEATPSREEVHQGSGKGNGHRRWEAIQSDRLWSENCMGKTAKSTEVPFSFLRCAFETAGGEDGSCNAASRSQLESDTPNCYRRRVDGWMDVDTSSRCVESSSVGRRPRKSGSRGKLIFDPWWNWPRTPKSCDWEAVRPQTLLLHEKTLPTRRRMEREKMAKARTLRRRTKTKPSENTRSEACD